MEFLASALVDLLLVPVESALGQEPALQPNGCILRANRSREASPVQKPQNLLESVTSAV
jgi:hypothetical protein